MKKTIKRLSAILAILVLSMTIAVPVTAVEYEDEMMPYAIRRIYAEPLSCEVDGYVVLNGSFNVAYDYDTDTLYVSCTSYPTEDAANVEFEEFGSYLVGNTDHVGRQPVLFNISSVGYSLEDETNAVYTEDVTRDFLLVSAGGTIRWGDEDDADNIYFTAENDIWPLG